MQKTTHVCRIVHLVLRASSAAVALFLASLTFAQTVAYVTDETQGVLTYSVNQTTGALSPMGTGVAAGLAIGLAVTPSAKFLYTTDLVTHNCTPGYVRGFSIDPNTGAVSPLPGSPVSSGGSFAYSVAVTPSGAFAYAANSCTNNIFSYSINQTTGALTPLSSFATGSDPTLITIDVFGRFLFVGNANSQDVSVYAINSVTGALTNVAGSPFHSGSDPYQMAQDPSGRFLFVPNANSNNIAVFAINPITGILTPVPGSPFTANSGPQAALVSPSGQFLFVACGYSNQVRAFAINAVTGALTEVSGSPFPAGNYPYSESQSPDGKFLYVPNAHGANISAYSVNAGSGSLTPLSASPFAAGPIPVAIAIAKLSADGTGPTCGATEVTSNLSLTQGAFVSSPPSFNTFSQRITLTNTSLQAISGPLYLVFDGLPATNTFYCPSPGSCSVYPSIAVTNCNSPSPNGGSVYGPLSGIAAGGSLSTTPLFLPATSPLPGSPYQMFNYTLRIFRGQPK